MNSLSQQINPLDRPLLIEHVIGRNPTFVNVAVGGGYDYTTHWTALENAGQLSDADIRNFSQMDGWSDLPNPLRNRLYNAPFNVPRPVPAIRVSPPQFELVVHCRGKDYKLNDHQAFFERGMEYVRSAFRSEFGLEPPKFLRCKVGDFEWPANAETSWGQLTEQVETAMRKQGRIVFSDANEVQRLYEASTSFLQSIVRSSKLQVETFEYLQRNLNRSVIVTSIEKMLRHTTSGATVPTEENKDLLQALVRCCGREPDSCSAGWRLISRRDGWDWQISSPPTSAEPYDLDSERLQWLAGIGGDEWPPREEEKLDVTAESLFGPTDVAFNDEYTRRNPVKLWTKKGETFCRIYYMHPSAECFAVLTQNVIELLRTELKSRPHHAFQMAVIVRGSDDYLLINQPQQSADGKLYSEVSPRTQVFGTGLSALPIVLLSIMSTLEKDAVAGFMTSRVAHGRILDFVGRGGFSFVWGFRMNDHPRLVLKVPRSREEFDRIEHFHRRAQTYGDIFMEPIAVDEQTNSFVYMCMEPMVNVGRISRDQWITFGRRLVEFHQQTNIVHFDISPANLYVHEGRVILGDFGSSWDRSEDNTNRVVNAAPEFYPTELSLTDSPQVDYVMLLRCVYVHRFGFGSVGNWNVCDVGMNVSTPDELEKAIGSILDMPQE